MAGGAVLMGGALFLLQRTGLIPLVRGLGTWILFGFLLFFSLAEVPMMILIMRLMIRSQTGTWLTCLTNAAFSCFAAVYAAPFVLLTGRVNLGAALAGLSLVRFVGALWLVAAAQHSPSSAPGNSYSTAHSEGS